MVTTERKHKRSGTTIAESAIIFPVFLLLVIGFIVGALGIFRYHQVASLAREAARYASVRGAEYEFTTGATAATPKDIYENAIKPNAVALDNSRLDYSVTWDPDNRQGAYVTVRVNYAWIPEVFFGGVTLSSTSRMVVSY